MNTNRVAFQVRATAPSPLLNTLLGLGASGWAWARSQAPKGAGENRVGTLRCLVAAGSESHPTSCPVTKLPELKSSLQAPSEELCPTATPKFVADGSCLGAPQNMMMPASQQSSSREQGMANAACEVCIVNADEASQFRRLKPDGCGFTKMQTECSEAADEACRIRRVRIADCGLKKMQTGCIEAVDEASRFRRLQIDDCGFTKMQTDCIVAADKACRIRRLKIVDCDSEKCRQDASRL